MQPDPGALKIGLEVVLPGRVVGKTQWENGNTGYCVAIKRAGKTEQLWLRADEMEVDDVD